MTLLHPSTSPLAQSHAPYSISSMTAAERIFRPWDDQDLDQGIPKPLSPRLKTVFKTETASSVTSTSSSASPIVSGKTSRSQHRSASSKVAPKCSFTGNSLNIPLLPSTLPNPTPVPSSSLPMIPPSFLTNPPAEWIASLEAIPHETLQHLVSLNAVTSSSELSQWYHQWMLNAPQQQQFHPHQHLNPLAGTSAAALPTRKQRPKKFRCPHCHVGFSNNGQLRGHVRSHTGERPFQCEESSCGKTFTRNEELTRHKRIHSGLRPFPCPVCGKRFGRRDHLKKHTRTHQKPPPLPPAPVCLLPSLSHSLAYSHAPFLPSQHPAYHHNASSATLTYPCYGL